MGEELYKKFKGDLGDAEDYIRKTYSGDEENYYLGKVEGYFGDLKRAQDEDDANASLRIIGMIRSGANLSQVNDAIAAAKFNDPRQAWQLEDLRDRHYQLGDYAPRRTVGRSGGGRRGGGRSGGGDSGGDDDGGGRRSDPAVVKALATINAKGSWLQYFPTVDVFINQCQGKLSASAYERYLNFYLDATGKKLPSETVKVKVNANSIMSRVAKEYHIAGDDLDDLSDRLNSKLDTFVRTYKKNPTSVQVRDIAKGLCTNVKTGETWSPNPFKGFKKDVTVPGFMVKLRKGQKIVNGEVLQEDPNSPSGWSRAGAAPGTVKKPGGGSRR